MYINQPSRLKNQEDSIQSSKMQRCHHVFKRNFAKVTFQKRLVQNGVLWHSFSSLKRNEHNWTNDKRFELVRDFVFDSLYNPQYGYFNSQGDLIFSKPKNKDLAPLEPLIHFGELRNQTEYIETLKKLYASQNQVWGTPVEIFQPYFAQAILNYILNKFEDKGTNPLLIYEIGGGTGTCALNILETLKQRHHSIYERTHYHIVEISSYFHNVQKERLDTNYKGHIQCHHKSIFEFRNEQHLEDHAFVIALEVMDNLPHDKIVEKADGSFVQIAVYESPGNKQDHPVYVEIELPLTDSLIQKYLRYTRPDLFDEDISSEHIDKSKMIDLRPRKYLRELFNRSTEKFRNLIMRFTGVGEQIYFLPTVQLLMIETICSQFPKHHVILADFDYLPQEDIILYTIGNAIYNQPIVQKKFEKSLKLANDTEGFNEEYLSGSFSTYLVPKGSCDIFFPTNFPDLQLVYACTRKDVHTGSTVMKMSQFLTRYLPSEQLALMQTKSGFNPALSDYSNFSFLVSGIEMH
jgi:hypothetical protein